MTIRPINDQVLVELDALPTVSASGLIALPESVVYDGHNRPDARKATVLAVGPGKWSKRGTRRVEPQVSPGDRVWVNAWLTDPVSAKQRIGYDGEYLLAEADILGFIAEDET